MDVAAPARTLRGRPAAHPHARRRAGLGASCSSPSSRSGCSPSSDYIFLPDKAHPVAPLVNVAGGHDPSDGGGIYFVDVIVRKASLLEQLFGGLHDGRRPLPGRRGRAARPRTTPQRRRSTSSRDAARRSRSPPPSRCARSARRSTRSPTGALVSRASSPGCRRPASSRPTDVIVAVDGKPVRSPTDVSTAMARQSRSARGSASPCCAAASGRACALKTVAAEPGLEARRRRRLPRARRADQAAAAGLDRRPRRRRPVGRARVRARRARGARPQRRPRPQDRRDRRDLPRRPGRPDRRHQAEDDRSARGGCGRLPRPGGQNARDARKYAHGLRIIPVKSFQQALHALATLPQQR